MPALQYKIIKAPEEAQSIWNLFSPHKTIYDEWELRSTFVDTLDLPFYFIVGYEKGKPVGLLPLQLNTVKGLGPRLLGMDKPYLEFFGGVDTDDNDVCVLPGYEQYIPDFYAQIKNTAILTSLYKQYQIGNSQSEFYLNRYELDLTNIANFETYLQTHFEGKSRRSIRNKIKYMHKTYKVEVREGSIDDLEAMFEMSINRFGEKSSFNLPYRQAVYKNLFQNFEHDLFVIMLDGVVSAVAFSLIFNKRYTLVNTGYDRTSRDIGKLLVSFQIERCIAKGCNMYDAGQGDNGWKERFNLTKIPQYKLALNN